MTPNQIETDLHPRMASVAYFSMEIALHAEIPTYSGGLGVLAGDTLRSAADLQLPMVAVSLLHRKGYFRQTLDPQGNQSESPETWDPVVHLEHLPVTAVVLVEGRHVEIGVWRYAVRGVSGHVVPVYLLDTCSSVNSPFDAALTDCLYGGDDHYRLCQEAVLGIGGCLILEKLGYEQIKSFHMNEGHSALLGLALLEREMEAAAPNTSAANAIDIVRRRCVFTTHTPVPAGNDRFSVDLARQVLGQARISLLAETDSFHDGVLNMTYLALRFAHYVNGVGMHHGEVSRGMFPNYPIRAITNGVHAVSWTAPSFQELYDRHIPEWRRDNLYLRYVLGISLAEIATAHGRAKQAMLSALHERTGTSLDPNVLTIGFARRAATYKRLELLFSDPERLKRMARDVGPMQIVYGGKAHPRDEGGKEEIRRVFSAASALHDAIKVVFVENYDLRWAQLLTSGTDLWLNTPQHPQEASGTSGMKAALNGVPSLSVMDGWWVEGHIQGVTGWSIGKDEPSGDVNEELASLYDALERIILPLYYGGPDSYTTIRRFAIALNGAFFNTQRMMAQYVVNAYAAQSWRDDAG